MTERSLALGLALGPIIDLFKGHTAQSILQQQILPGESERGDPRERMSRLVFIWLLLESSWRCAVTRLETQVREAQQEATTTASDQAFKTFAGLRRQLADAYGILAEARDYVGQWLKYYPFWNVSGKDLSAEGFWSAERSRPVATNMHRKQPVDVRDLPQLLEELLGRIKIMTQTVNEETQMVIGSVQVEDARVMRRQTEWTVVLAVLAAIYLPMTLVTGIFGMNITEIGAEATAPDRWSVVKAWGVVFGATVGSVLVYSVVRYVLRYRRVVRMLLQRRMRMIGDGRLYRRFLEYQGRLQESWLYQKFHGFREKMREWDVEAQKMEKME